MEAEGDDRVAVLDLRDRAVEWAFVAAELERLRLEAGADVVVVAVNGGTEIAGFEGGSDARVARFELPVIAALAGAVRDGTAEFALACDIRVGDESLRLTLPTSSERLRLLFPGKDGVRPEAEVNAEEALARGLVSRVAPRGETAFELARKVASVIAGRGPLATRLAKEALWRGLAMPMEQALRFETDLTLLLQTTKDRAEGVRAFLEKRPPTFEGE
ncbi:MAG TPA: enoyl-CoA hydratase-related protein [Tepidiformaceae bacterium]